MVLCHDVEAVLVGIIDDFVQPDDVWVLQALEDFQLLDYAVVGRLCLPLQLLLQHALAHLLDRVRELGLCIDTELDCGKRAFTEGLDDSVLVDHATFAALEALQSRCADRRGLSLRD